MFAWSSRDGSLVVRADSCLRGGVNLGESAALNIRDTVGSRERAMIGLPIEHKLAIACERRIGRVVDVASTFNLRRVASPAGNFNPRRPLPVVVALAEDDLWLLEFRYRLVGFDVGAVLCRFPRRGLVSQWHNRSWAWPAVWKADLSWPELATYVQGSLIGGVDADRFMGFLAADEFDGAKAQRHPTTEGE
jgi:hypothetical protein